MNHTPEETAALLALLTQRADADGISIPHLLRNTVLIVSRRKVLKRSFLRDLHGVLRDEFDLHLVQYKNGNFALLSERVGENTAPTTARKFLAEHRSKNQPIDFAAVWAELGYEVELEEPDVR